MRLLFKTLLQWSHYSGYNGYKRLQTAAASRFSAKQLQNPTIWFCNNLSLLKPWRGDHLWTLWWDLWRPLTSIVMYVATFRWYQNVSSWNKLILSENDYIDTVLCQFQSPLQNEHIEESFSRKWYVNTRPLGVSDIRSSYLLPHLNAYCGIAWYELFILDAYGKWSAADKTHY
jgi:hypothetical protein